MIGMAKRISRKISRGQKGQVLPIVLVLLVIGGLLVAPTLQYASTSLKGHQVTERNVLEIYAADSGVEDAIYWVTQGKGTGGPWDWDEGVGSGERDTYSINDKAVDVTVEALPEANTYKITSTATSAEGSTTVLSTVWAIVWFDSDTTFDNQNPPPSSGDIHVDADVTLEGNIEFEGTLTASGNVTTLNNVRITGDIGVGVDLDLEYNANIVGTMCVGGDLAIGNGCTVRGTVRMQAENATIRLAQAGCEMPANIWADGNLTIDLDTNAPIEGDIYAPAGNIDIYLRSPNAEIIGDIYAGGTIQILDDKGTHIGTIFQSYSGEPPFPEPECPVQPTEKANVYTYEIT